MKLIYFYTQNGPARQGRTHWDKNFPSQNRYIKRFVYDGVVRLLSLIKKSGLVEDVLIIIESNRNPGCFEVQGMKGYVVPLLTEVLPMIGPRDILFVRGGFRSWHNVFEKYKGKNWLMLYAANTGRQKWPWWDVVLDDLSSTIRIDSHDRLFYPYIKPIPDDFKIKKREPKYDFCIGASHIHDKKGQWKVVDAIVNAKHKYYDDFYYKNFSALLPGDSVSGFQSKLIKNKIRKYDLNITMPGMLSREEMIDVYNDSKIFVKGGAHGQNDRGLLEAVLCGCFPVLMSNNRHPKFINKIFREGIFDCSGSIDDLVKKLIMIQCGWSQKRREKIASQARKYNGFDVAYNSFENLLSTLVNNPQPDANYLRKLL